MGSESENESEREEGKLGIGRCTVKNLGRVFNFTQLFFLI